MVKANQITRHLPLSEATYYIMLMLEKPRHGYGVMQKVEEITQGVITIGPGTLYGAFSTLEKEGLIEMVRSEHRRKVYVLTEIGRAVLRGQIERLCLMLRSEQQVLEHIGE
jgi:DNA-binding PadR family transcriptional regulator